jgi:(p)ppGpp synthase/HD superfamily hydrolase
MKCSATELASYFTPAEKDLLDKAYSYAEAKHTGQLRQEGTAYITHLEAVAEILMSWGCDAEIVAAGLLHDVIEDTEATLEEVEESFGKRVGFLVDGATKIVTESKQESDKLTQEKITNYAAKDPGVAYVKVADRMHNLRTIHFLPQGRRQRIIAESRDFYMGLAKGIGKNEDLNLVLTQL